MEEDNLVSGHPYEVLEGLRIETNGEPKPEVEVAEESQSGLLADAVMLDEPQKTETEESPTADAIPAQVENVKKIYTPEEIEQTLKDDGKIDYERLSPEGKLVYKSYDRGLKPKLEERAQLARELDTLRNEFVALKGQIPQPQKEETLQDIYNRDTVSTEMYIDQAIQSADDYDEKIRLTNMKFSLFKGYTESQTMAMQKREQQINAQNYMQTFANQVKTAVPEYNPEYANELTQYATKNMGYTSDELKYLTHPQLGITALKNLKVISDNYKRDNASKKLVDGTLTQTPPSVESAGSGIEPKKPVSWTQNDYENARMGSLI